MPKSLVLGNGSILVGFDPYGQIKDFYFPHVGMENHVHDPHYHRIGVWMDNSMHWFDDGSWDIAIDCKEETAASLIKAVNKEFGIELVFTDVVYNEKNIFIREIKVKNNDKHKKQVKLFLHNEFEIYESHRGDTAYFDPGTNSIVHYKGRRVFLINARVRDWAFEEYSIGNFGIEGKEGTWKDAEDGLLSKNPIEHGNVDSIIGIPINLEDGGEETVYYWIVVGLTHEEIKELNYYVIEKTPPYLMRTSQDFWHAWLNRIKFSFHGLSPEIVTLFKKSLVFIRAHADNEGAIIASADSDMLHSGRDTYSYMWPRDAAMSAMALDRAGDSNIAQRFFEFSNAVLAPEGYFMHKYQADKSWGSSWHPWVRDGHPALPIQEDETALVLFALWEHYARNKDLEFIENLYNSLIKRSADFLNHYFDEKINLPKPSYDLWEEKYGTSTFTAASVYGALTAAAKFAKLLGKSEAERKYNETAERIKKGILEHLYDEKAGYFIKMIEWRGQERVLDKTLDTSSVYGIFKFGVLPPGDPRVKSAMKKTEDELLSKTSVGGMPRYRGDRYYANSELENPWFTTTLWIAQYYIRLAKNEEDLTPVKKWLSWTAKHALPSGILSEQLDPHTGRQISAAPLTWSHSEFVITVTEYLEKLEELGICKACYPL